MGQSSTPIPNFSRVRNGHLCTELVTRVAIDQNMTEEKPWRTEVYDRYDSPKLHGWYPYDGLYIPPRFGIWGV